VIRKGGAPRVAIFYWFFGSPLLAVSSLFFPFTAYRSPFALCYNALISWN